MEGGGEKGLTGILCVMLTQAELDAEKHSRSCEIYEIQAFKRLLNQPNSN